ncbi:MAG: hypothetical protein ACRD03_17050, partial [Acidimicrobiales bacterium]
MTPVVPHGPAAAEPKAPVSVRDLPGIASPPAPKVTPPVPERPIERLDQVAPHPSELAELNRRDKPSAFDPARSTPIDSETTPTRRVWANPDGTRTLQAHTRPVRYQDGSGAWRDFDLTPVPAPDGTLRARSAPAAARLGARAG